jgi:S-methylmethionine-dependent homocysteine/selenocysteine methylase
MINCAHASHFDHVLGGDEEWMQRIYGVRANASCKSHAELDEATELDDGNPAEFGQDYAALGRKLSNLRVVGGCCGTDHRHIGEVCRSLEIDKREPQSRVA